MNGVDQSYATGGVAHTSPPPVSPNGLVHAYFKREVGPLTRAHAMFGQVLTQPMPTSPAAQAGVRYEKKVLRFLSATFPGRLATGLPFSFLEASGTKGRCVPDALLFSLDWRAVCVIEVKIRHTGDAWHQLNKFYIPIVQKAFPLFRVCGMEICAGYDPGQKLPQQVAFVDNPEVALAIRGSFHPVMVFTEREARSWKGG